MKKNIHPTLHERKIKCSCGYEFMATLATKASDTLEIERCPKCHPFYTGVEITLDTAGTIDKFKKRYNY